MSKEMPDLYQIKYRQNGSRKWRYGTVDKYHEEAKKAWASRHFLLVDDAIYPVAHWVDYDNDEVEAIPFSHEFDRETGCMKDEYSQYVHSEYAKAQKKSDAATGLVDKMFSVGVGDGSAYYVIVKENKKTVKIEWRCFSCDNYMDQFMGIGGTFDKDRIEPFVRRGEGLKALFSKKEGVEA